MKTRYIPKKVDAMAYGGGTPMIQARDFIMSSLLHPATGRRAGYQIVFAPGEATLYGAPWMFPLFKRLFKAATDPNEVEYYNAQSILNDSWVSDEPMWKRTASEATFNRYIRQYYKRQAQIEADAANGVTMIYG